MQIYMKKPKYKIGDVVVHKFLGTQEQALIFRAHLESVGWIYHEEGMKTHRINESDILYKL